MFIIIFPIEDVPNFPWSKMFPTVNDQASPRGRTTAAPWFHVAAGTGCRWTKHGEARRGTSSTMAEWMKIISQNGSFPQVGVNIKTYLKPPPRCLGLIWFDGSLNGQLVAVDWLWIVCEKCSFGCFVVVPFVSKI